MLSIHWVNYSRNWPSPTVWGLSWPSCWHLSTATATWRCCGTTPKQRNLSVKRSYFSWRGATTAEMFDGCTVCILRERSFLRFCALRRVRWLWAGTVFVGIYWERGLFHRVRCYWLCSAFKNRIEFYATQRTTLQTYNNHHFNTLYTIPIALPAKSQQKPQNSFTLSIYFKRMQLILFKGWFIRECFSGVWGGSFVGIKLL